MAYLQLQNQEDASKNHHQANANNRNSDKVSKEISLPIGVKKLGLVGDFAPSLRALELRPRLSQKLITLIRSSPFVS